MIVETVPVKSLELDPENARKHSERNLNAIQGSLAAFGQRRPLVVHGSTVIAGNGTLQAAIALGWETVTITRTPDDWTIHQARAYALADNKTAELADWDDTILADQISDLNAEGFDVTEFGFDAPLVQDIPDFRPDEDDQPRLDQREAIMCPECAFEWRVGPRGEVEPL
jgi:ParB-like chromosome segregation protein Spo0J